MTRGAYYNEFDSGAAAWLRELIKAGQIAAGDVDERSIEDVQPDDLRSYAQCHFFAGIGGWSLALRRAGWDDTRPVWTGSCPCQPFSPAGAGKGFADERHLWPAFFHLIEQCRPAAVFGEQVAGPAGLVWLDLVQADLEAAGYAVGAADLCAAGVGAPHIRQRLYWVAHVDGERLEGGNTGAMGHQRTASQRGCGSGGLADGHQHGRAAVPVSRLHHHERDAEPCGSSGWVADSTGTRQRAQPGQRGAELDARSAGDARASGRAGWLADVHGSGCAPGREGLQAVGHGSAAGANRGAGSDGLSGPLHGHWRDADWLLCRDGKWRPVEPGTFPLAHGLPRGLVRGGDQRLAPNSSTEGRLMRLRGYGNAIVPQVASAFISASMG